MRKLFWIGAGGMTVLLVACGAARWTEPDSWTLRADGRIRASQRGEDFDFAGWKAKYLDPERQVYGIVLTPGGTTSIANELARRDAKILELQNQLQDCGR